KDYSAEQVKYNSLIQRRSRKANLTIPATIADRNNTLLRWPQLYYASTLLFQDINFNMNTGNKLMLDFYQILHVNILGHGNNTLDSLQANSTEQGLSKYRFSLAQAQRDVDADDTYTINPIRKDFHIRAIILQVETSCELSISQAQVPNNSHLLAENVFEDLNDLINNKPNSTPILPPEDDNNRQPLITINTPTTTINLLPTTTINTPTTTINLPPTITINTLSSRPTNFPKIITTEIPTTTTNKPTTSVTTKPSSMKPTSITTTLSTPKINFINTVCDKLGMKKQSIVFHKIKELVSKLTNIQVKELIDKIQKLIEKYREKFIEYIPDEMKQQILYNFDKIMI
ncbi:489_t:CDS:2, partial [Racocetra persica]